MKSFATPSKTVANRTNGSSQRVSQTAKTITNNRPQAIIQRKLQEMANSRGVLQAKSAKGGLPEDLKAGIEALSGISLDGVKVHYNSSKPAEVRALAYAQGNDIYLAPGQEKYLAHEAWHVVQQKQGRVRPTTQTPDGASINDNVGLEMEADFMGKKASMHDLSSHVESTKKLGSDFSTVKQRAVGFEFETGWLISKIDDDTIDTLFSTHDDIMLENKTVSLKKKESIGTQKYNGFKLEADEAGNDKSEIEFIIDPPIVEDASGLQKLCSIMKAIEELGNKLISKSDQESFTLDQITGLEDDRVYKIEPADKVLSAGPQVTSGLDLAKIPRLFNYKKNIFSNEVGLLAPEELKQSLKGLQGDAEKIQKVNKKISPQLLGLLTLIRNYLEVGKGQVGEVDHGGDEYLKWNMALNYPKRIAEPLLARTHFGKLFQLIEPKEIIHYTKHEEEWLNLVVQSSQAGSKKRYDLDKPVIERGIQEDETGDKSFTVKNVGPTRREWLLSILGADDALTRMEDHESMGELGNKLESVGDKGTIDAGIFEFRGAQTSKIPLKDWSKFAFKFFEYIMALHSNSMF